ncbi:Vacuolar protein-sorting-associated protein 36 [Smittium mucronatum]|uniref:Vacuolar protein-sorting-associated protein 36 n=1 Tax=Smittium mucronatum TaxID=133383 RepID=A0A1R0GWA6_9FUNG|nr:Vacuolar protein-sorting-associated protein 36 [Smittium mucronatum]
MECCDLGYTKRPLIGDFESVVLISELLTMSGDHDERRECTAYITNSRVVFVDKADPDEFSAQLRFQNILSVFEETRNFWSKTKVVIQLKEPDSPELAKESDLNIIKPGSTTGEESITSVLSMSPFEWKCTICEHINIGYSEESGKCELCGVVEKNPQKNALVEEGGLVCGQCTFLNHVDLENCEICSSPLRGHTVKFPTINVTKMEIKRRFWLFGAKFIVIRFIKGGSTQFFSTLEDQINKFRNEKSTTLEVKKSENSDVALKQDNNEIGGISAIILKTQNEKESMDLALGEAFTDLDALSLKAKEMVDFAKSIVNKLVMKNVESGESGSSAEFQKYLSTIGINDPVTK